MRAGLIAFFIAMATSFALTVLVRKIAIRIGMVDQPGSRKIHLEPTPLLGGVAMYVAIVFALVISNSTRGQSQLLAIISGATLLLLVGTADDRGLLHHQVKLFVAMPAAALIVLVSGIRAQVFSEIFPGRIGSSADSLLTVFWVTGITAAFSILDYMDGVCAGIAVIASTVIAVLAILNSQLLVAVIAAAVAGAAIGFLWWNFSPAKIFMGDGGAMMLGFLTATLALLLRVSSRSAAAAWLAPLFVLAVPILDTTLVSVSRLRRGRIPFTSPGKDHVGHRLANTGMGVRASVLSMYALAVICGLAAILSTRLNPHELAAAAVVGLLCFAAGVAFLERLPYQREE